MASENAKQNKSILDWLTMLAAWLAVGLGIWNSYVQYSNSKIRPDLYYGSWGAKYKVSGAPSELAHLRCIFSNRGYAAATDVRVKIWDVPKDAKIWCSLEYEIIDRTDKEVLINIAIIPPRMNGFLTVHPFDPSGLATLPYVQSVYSLIGKSDRDERLNEWAKLQIMEHLSKTEGYQCGFSGWHRTWDEPITDDDILDGSSFFTINDR